MPDDVWNEAARHYNERELSALILAIGVINVWNRVNVTTRQIAGDWTKSAKPANGWRSTSPPTPPPDRSDSGNEKAPSSEGRRFNFELRTGNCLLHPASQVDLLRSGHTVAGDAVDFYLHAVHSGLAHRSREGDLVLVLQPLVDVLEVRDEQHGIPHALQ